MTEFRTRYRGSQYTTRTGGTAGHITVTAMDVQVVTRVPHLPTSASAGLFLLWFATFFTVIPLSVFFGHGFALTSLPPVLHLIYPWVFMASLILITVANLILRRSRLTIPSGAITTCTVNACELLLQTAADQHVYTANTTADAQALAAAIRDGAVPSITMPVKCGRESLLDQSGFSHLWPIALSVTEGAVTLRGHATAGTERQIVMLLVMVAGMFLPMVLLIPAFKSLPDWVAPVSLFGGYFIGICVGCLLIYRTPPKIRALPLAELYEITAIHHFVTFLAPDEKVHERRYTLTTPSPEDAKLLARRLRGKDDGAFEATYKSALNRKNDASIGRYLLPATADGPTRPGAVQIDDKHVTFTGHSGLPHPWAWRLAALAALVASALLAPALRPFVAALQLDDQAMLIITWVPAAMLALLFVYLPASRLFTHLLATRVTVLRSKLLLITHLGREVTVSISTTSSYPLTLAFDSDHEAASFLEALTSPQP